MTFCMASMSAYAEHYNYRIEIGKGTDVCDHMGIVFNKQFQKIWDYGDRTKKRSPEFDAIEWKDEKVVIEVDQNYDKKNL